MRLPRPFSLIRTNDQWLRASHVNTALQGEVVQLYWRDRELESGGEEQFDERGGGLASDGHCRLYRSVPAEGSRTRYLGRTRSVASNCLDALACEYSGDGHRREVW